MRQYKDLMMEIMFEGYKCEDRTGVGTTAIFGHQMKFDLQEGFPLLSLREINFDMIVSELLWMLEGSTDERRLAEIRYGKPREELVGKKTIWTANADKQGVELGYTNNDKMKELGPVYGHQWRNWETKEGWYVDQIQQAIDMINTNPDSRRIIVSAWNVADLEAMALPPCHTLFQFRVLHEKLHCQLYQRSADVFLGIPANIASYALLIHMIAMVTNLEVGTLTHTIGDTHIYDNHMRQCQEMLDRIDIPLPELQLEERRNINGFKMSDFSLLNYNPHPKISGAMAT